MIKGDYEKLQNIAKYNLCAECKAPLLVSWFGEGDTHVIRCGICGYPDAVTHNPSLTEEYKQGEEIPEPVKSNIEKSMRRRAMQQGKQSTAVTFQGVPAVDLATGELLLPEVVKSLINYAQRYGLDPARGHVVMMYSKPYITIDGYLFYAHLSHRPYSLSSRPMTTEELHTYKIGETDHGWISQVNFLDNNASFTGTGIVTYEEMTAKSPRDASKLRSPVVAAHPWQLAQKRAEWQALRRAFPIGETQEKTIDTEGKV